jgi:hypothetical protein
MTTVFEFMLTDSFLLKRRSRNIREGLEKETEVSTSHNQIILQYNQFMT